MKNYFLKSLKAFLMLGFCMVCACSHQEMKSEDTLEHKNSKAYCRELIGVQNGIYQGSALGRGFNYEIEVEVRDQRFDRITILRNKEHNKYAKKGEAIIDVVMQEQSLAVDSISGATVTSKAFLEAIANALKTAPRK